MKSNLALIQRSPRPAHSGHHVCAPKVASVATTNEIDRQSCLGLVQAPDGKAGLAESNNDRHVVEVRARRVLDKRIKFVGHPDFYDSSTTAEILGPMPGSVGGDKRRGNVRARDVFASAGANSQTSQFLTREQEVHLFRKMNFLKYQAAQLRASINPSRAHSADLDRVEELLGEACAIRDTIVCSYLALVVSIVLKWTGRCHDYLDVVSEGNVCLIRASEGFDCTRGARFSTFLTRVIINDCVRRVSRDRRRRVRFVTGREGLLKCLTDFRDRDHADALDQEPSRRIIKSMLGYLNDREQTIIDRRFGLSREKETLAQLSHALGISDERVRQLESRAWISSAPSP